MDDLDDDVSSTGFESLFIKEEEGDPERTAVEQRESHKTPPGLRGTQLKQSALMKPYLQEMDELLKSCEELTGISFGSQYSATYADTSQSESSCSRGKEEGGYGETRASPHDYLSTSYMDTHEDGSGAEEEMSVGVIDRYEVPQQTEMPLTSAGNKLSETMVEYEGQLLGMLAMLENCMEEAGMDFEPQDWLANSGQEYINIMKDNHQYQPLKLETPSMQAKSFKTSEDSMRTTAGSATNGNQPSLLSGWEKLLNFPVERPEMQGHLERDQGVHDTQMSFPDQQISAENTKQDPTYCEGTKAGYMFNEGTDNGEASEERSGFNMDIVHLGSGINELRALGSQMEESLAAVQQLEKKRKELLMEVLQLRGNEEREGAGGTKEEEETEEWIGNKVVELMRVIKREEEGRREERKKEIHSLKEERAEEERKMWKVNLERQGLQEELRKQKRRLFAAARDCAHSQAALNNQRREVELLKREKEQLNSLLHQLTEESSTLRSAQQEQLSDLRAKLHAHSSSQSSNAQEELTECRRSSCGDVQQYLQGGLKALEDRYEPVLLALLKRREATAGALVKAKEQAQELRAQLTPLREEMLKLQLQRACLEEKLKLVYIQRCEDVGRYKEAVYHLEESSRELKTELEIQKRKTKEMEELRDSLAKQLLLHRAAIEDQKEHDLEDKT